MNYYIDVLKKYATFSGRATRSEYWYFVLFSTIISVILGVISSLVGDEYGILGLIYSLFVFIPSLAVFVRRLHDVNRSGWFIFIGLIPLVGAIWLLVLACTDSQNGSNQYGPNPKN